MTGCAWVTLATNDTYCLGALVLGHSLKRVCTQHQLAIIITPQVSPSMREQLSKVFNVIQQVDVLDSNDATNLALLQRPELGVTFTKIHCWTLTQFSKCVFLDADTLVIQNCDELFEREELSAAPDPGWPDCFNSGVFVFVPSQDTYQQLIQFASTHGSFDGGDQGLLNMYFNDWPTNDIRKHLSFLYNMCSTSTYTYLPALNYYGANIKIVHFIGTNKPWLMGPSSAGMSTFAQSWWDLFQSNVAYNLNTQMSGLAGALGSKEKSAIEEEWRKQNWEQGNIDFTGRDSFEHIWQKIMDAVNKPKQDITKKPEDKQQPPIPKEIASQAIPEKEKADLPKAAKEDGKSAPPLPISAPPTLPSATQPSEVPSSVLPILPPLSTPSAEVTVLPSAVIDAPKAEIGPKDAQIPVLPQTPDLTPSVASAPLPELPKEAQIAAPTVSKETTLEQAGNLPKVEDIFKGLELQLAESLKESLPDLPKAKTDETIKTDESSKQVPVITDSSKVGTPKPDTPNESVKLESIPQLPLQQNAPMEAPKPDHLKDTPKLETAQPALPKQEEAKSEAPKEEAIKSEISKEMTSEASIPADAKPDADKTEALKQDATKVETLKLEATKSDVPKQEAAKPEAPKQDVAKPEAPKQEAAKPEAPKQEAAKPEAPKQEAAKPEAPKQEAAKPEAPKQEEAKPETPKQEAVKPEAPKQEATKPETPKQETAKPEVPKQEAAKPEVPKQEAAKPEAPKQESAKPDETKAGSPKLEAAKPEDPKQEAVKPDASKQVEAKGDASKIDASKVDQSKNEVTKDAPLVEPPKPETAKVDATKVEQPKVEAPKPDAAKPDSPKPDVTKTEVPHAKETTSPSSESSQITDPAQPPVPHPAEPKPSEGGKKQKTPPKDQNQKSGQKQQAPQPPPKNGKQKKGQQPEPTSAHPLAEPQSPKPSEAAPKQTETTPKISDTEPKTTPEILPLTPPQSPESKPDTQPGTPTITAPTPPVTPTDAPKFEDPLSGAAPTSSGADVPVPPKRKGKEAPKQPQKQQSNNGKGKGKK